MFKPILYLTFMRKLHRYLHASSYLSFREKSQCSLTDLLGKSRLSARGASDDERVIEAGGAGRRCKQVSGLESLMNA